MHQNFTRKTLAVLLSIFIPLMILNVDLRAQTRNYALTLQSYNGGIINEDNAADGNISTYAELTASAGLLLLGPTANVTVAFPENVPEGTDVYIVLSQPGNASLLRSLLGGTLGNLVNSALGVLIDGTPTITTTLLTNGGGTVLNSTLTGSSTANVLYGPEGHMYLKITATGTFRRVRIHLSNPALLGIGGILAGSEIKLRVHDVFYLSGATDPCAPFVTTKYDATGITASVLTADNEPIRNPHFAIDNDESTASELGYDGLLGAYVGSTLSQTIQFNTLSDPDEQPVITFDRNASLLTLDLLNAINISAFNGTTSVYSGTAAGLLSLDALGILSLTVGGTVPDKLSVPVTGVFDRVVISYSQTVGVGIADQPLRIYDVTRAPRIPQLSAYSYSGCEGLDLSLDIISPVATVDYEWYDSDMTLIYTGNSYDYPFPGDGISDTLLVRAVSTCGNSSAFQPLVVTGNEITCLTSVVSGTVDISEYTTSNPLKAVLTDLSHDAVYIEDISLIDGSYSFSAVAKGDYYIFIINTTATVGDDISASVVDPGFTVTHSGASLSVNGAGAPVSADPFIITSSPLSHLLISFDGKRNDQFISLFWEISSDNKISSFEIEMSLNGRDFTSIGSNIDAVSNKVNYAFNHLLNISNDNVYFRLKLNNSHDDKYSYSQIIKLDHQSAQAYTVFPNPASSQLSINLINGQEKIVIYNNLGRVVYSQNADGLLAQINIESLIPGIYYIQVINADGVINHLNFSKL